MKRFLKNKKGFSLIELLISISIFAIIMVAVSDIFGKSMRGYKRNVGIQRDMEAAQQAMNFMAKTLRTSTIVTTWNPNGLAVFDYSRTSNRCVAFFISDPNMWVGYSTAADGSAGNYLDCPSAIGSYQWQTLTDNTIVRIDNYSWNIVQSSGSTVGKITLSFRACPPNGCSLTDDQIRIQSTVSLRDYDNTNIGD